MKYELEDAIQQLYFWQYPSKDHSPSFSQMLFDLIQKADDQNLSRIAKGFPTHVMAWMMWNKAGDYGNQLFRDHGLMSDEIVQDEK